MVQMPAMLSMGSLTKLSTPIPHGLSIVLLPTLGLSALAQSIMEAKRSVRIQALLNWPQQ